MKAKNLSQLKKSLKVNSVVTIVENAIKSYHNGESRFITKVQSNSINTLRPDGTNSWIDWQKASEMRFNDDGTIDFLFGDLVNDAWLIEQQAQEGKDYWLKLQIQ